MARKMPPLGTRFADAARSAAAIAQAGELARADARPDSRTYRDLTPARLEALYEMAYLRVFIAWEDLLEESFVRLMCGYESGGYSPQFKASRTRQKDIATARTSLYGPRDYLLWHNPHYTIQRCSDWFVDGIHSRVIASDLADLEQLAKVRHRIAHASAQVQQGMDGASMHLAGRRYPGASAGRFLRDWKTDDPLVQERQLRVLTNQLVALAIQIAP